MALAPVSQPQTDDPVRTQNTFALPSAFRSLSEPTAVSAAPKAVDLATGSVFGLQATQTSGLVEPTPSWSARHQSSSSQLAAFPSSELEPASPAVLNRSTSRVDGPVLLKLLINTAWATALIGRQGCNIKALSSTTGCAVQLSEKSSFFPGTKARVLLIKGSLAALNAALEVVLARRDELPIQAANPSEVDCASMLVPTSLCAQLRGAKDDHLQQLEQESGAALSFAHRDKQGPRIPDRILRVVGTRSQTIAGILAVLRFLLVNTPYRSTVTGLTPFKSVTIPTPARAVGAIMGKGGEAIEELQNLMGVSMSMGGDKAAPYRELVISGLPQCILMTVELVLEKVWQVEPHYMLPVEVQQVLTTMQATAGSPAATGPGAPLALRPSESSNLRSVTLPATLTVSAAVSTPMGIPVNPYAAQQAYWQPYLTQHGQGRAVTLPTGPQQAAGRFPAAWQDQGSANVELPGGRLMPMWQGIIPWTYHMPPPAVPFQGPAMTPGFQGPAMTPGPFWVPTMNPAPAALPRAMFGVEVPVGASASTAAGCRPGYAMLFGSGYGNP